MHHCLDLKVLTDMSTLIKAVRVRRSFFLSIHGEGCSKSHALQTFIWHVYKSFGEGCNVSEKSFINVYMDMITRAKNKIYYVTF